MQKESGVTPQALRNMPVLPPELVSVYNAFNILNRARGQNMAGEQPIKISEVSAYLAVAGENCPDTRLFKLKMISEMDRTYLVHVAKKAAAK